MGNYQCKGNIKDKEGKMRHAVPLTRFQERLFEVVINAFVKHDLHSYPSNNNKLRPTYKEVNTKQDLENRSIVKEEYHSNMKMKKNPIHEKIETFFEIVWGLLTDNMHWIFPVFMIGNIFWLQIELVWMSNSNQALTISITVMKWLLIFLLCGYYCYSGFMKIKKFLEKHISVSKDKVTI